MDKNQEKNSKKDEILSDKIEVKYFHNVRRCATCVAVENVTLATLKELYGTQMSKDSLIFNSFELDDTSFEELINKYEVSGPSLLIISGDKVENLTTDAFMNARTNPDKLKELIKITIDPLLAD